MKNISVLILSKSLKKEGGVVNFISTLLQHMSPNITAHSFQIADYHSRGRWFGLRLFVGDIVKLYKAVKHFNVDCVHINPSLNRRSLIRDLILIQLMSIFIPRVGMLCVLHGWNNQTAASIKSNAVLSRLIAHSFNRCNTVLVLASTFKQDLEAIGVTPSKICVISTMFNTDLLSANDVIVEKPVKTLLFLSRFVKEKGIYELLEAFSRTVERHPHLKLMMAGDGPEKHSIEQWIETHRLQHHVELVGYVRGAAKAKILQQADLFVFPTYYGEGCPVSLLEALAAGLPVLTTRVGGIGDVIAHEKNGILLDEVTPENVENALEVFLNMSPKQLRSMGDLNHKEAWQKYEANVVTRNLEHVYYRIASQAA